MRISQLRLKNWKNFKETSAAFADRTFVIGPNASGKSNLLDALRFLRDVARSGLGEAVGSRGGVSSIRCLAARQYSDVLVGVRIADEHGDLWDYELEFNQDNLSVPVVKREQVRDLRSGATVLQRPVEEDLEDHLLLTQTHLEQIAANKRFRALYDFFDTISYQHIVPQVVRDPRGFSAMPVKNDPYGRDFLVRIHATNQQTRDAWLKRVAEVLRTAVPQLKELGIEMDTNSGVPHLVARYEHWRPHAARQSEAQLSDGTLRLLGLLWSVFEGSGPLLLEEPELSLHPEVVRALPGLFERIQQAIRGMRKGGDSPRQIVISTHSEELLDNEGIGAHEVLRIQPGAEGSEIHVPSAQERLELESGLTVADVILPRSAPAVQLRLDSIW
jgi:predicted ATPase